jgi:hypothetical protein
MNSALLVHSSAWSSQQRSEPPRPKLHCGARETGVQISPKKSPPLRNFGGYNGMIRHRPSIRVAVLLLSRVQTASTSKDKNAAPRAIFVLSLSSEKNWVLPDIQRHGKCIYEGVVITYKHDHDNLVRFGRDGALRRHNIRMQRALPILLVHLARFGNQGFIIGLENRGLKIED